MYIMKNSTNSIILIILAITLIAAVFSYTNRPEKNNFVTNSAVQVFRSVTDHIDTGTKSLFSIAMEGGATSTASSTETTSSSTEEIITTPKKISISSGRYLEVLDGCGPYFEGACLSVRNGPGTSYDKLYKLRSGTVLKVVGTKVTTEEIMTVTGSSTATSSVERTWYKIGFDEWIRYPDRLETDSWYVLSDHVRLIKSQNEAAVGKGVMPKNDKKIIVDRSEQKLYAYEGDVLFMKQTISTGKEGNATPRGTFSVYRKTPSRYMQGPLPGISAQEYDLPGVPWVMYFTEQGGAIHGAYWHDKFGQPWSHGCVNLPVEQAEKLYDWADIGTAVVVRD
jgi:hypothetical protein